MKNNFVCLIAFSFLFILVNLISGCSSKQSISAPSIVQTPTPVAGVTTLTVSGLCSLTPAAVLTPCGIAVNNAGTLFLADIGHNRIIWCDPHGNTIGAVGGPGAADRGTGNSQFFGPYGVAIDALNNIYVIDTYNDRVQKFDSSFNYLTQWGTSGSGNSSFLNPMGIAVDANGNVFVADTYNNRIQKFSSIGSFIKSWGTTGQANGQFVSPTAVAVDSSGLFVYVTDTGNNRVQKFDSSGNYVSQWGGFVPNNNQGWPNPSGWPPCSTPWGIAVDKNGNVFVCDTANSKILKYDANGNFITSWVTLSANGYDDMYPWGVTVDNTGAVYVVFFINNPLTKYIFS
jgi:DNA-binding beta-propeller fold protein YncE